jgi:hypothetical protein
MLKTHYQSCGGRGALCHATLLHGSVPPITRSRIPGQLHITVIVIYFILHNKCVAAKRVAVFGLLKPCRKFPSSRYTPSCNILSSGAKRGRFLPCAHPPKIGHGKPRIPDGDRRLSVLAPYASGSRRHHLRGPGKGLLLRLAGTKKDALSLLTDEGKGLWIWR